MILNNRNAFLEAVRKKGTIVGSILNLQFPDGNGLYEIEARDLARLLVGSGLEVLKMRHVNLQGDLTPFLTALSRQKRLRSFQAEFCNFPYRIAMAVSFLPCLETLNIVGHKGFRWRRPLPVKMATKLLQKGNMRDLRLDTLLDFHGPAAKALFQAISGSHLEVFWCLNSSFSDAQVALVANLLEQSTTLTDIRFSVASGVSNTDLISQALKTNTTLTNLGIRLQGEQDPTPNTMKSFLEVLQGTNCTLTDLILARGTQWDADQRRHIPVYSNDETSHIYSKIDYYLALNRCGRGALLLDTATPEDHLAAIASQWNLSILFYFCRVNPTLILAGVPPPSQATKAHDQAVLRKRCSALFPDALRNGILTLLGPRQVQDALMCLPESVSITDLSIRFVDRAPLSWMDLAQLIERCGEGLGTILVEGAELASNQNPEKFLNTLSNATHLIHLSVRNCNCGMSSVVGLTRVLSGLSCFESLGWTGNQEASLTFEAINTLLRNRPIKFLALDRVEGGDKDLQEFFALLEASTSLKVLRCEMHPQGFSSIHSRQLGQALAVNQSIENLQIHVSSEADLAPLAKALETNQSLTGLHITGLEPLPDLMAFVNVLETHNSTLKSLMIGSRDLSTCGGVAGQLDCVVERIRVLLRANIARSRPLPLPKACYNPA